MSRKVLLIDGKMRPFFTPSPFDALAHGILGKGKQISSSLRRLNAVVLVALLYLQLRSRFRPDGDQPQLQVARKLKSSTKTPQNSPPPSPSPPPHDSPETDASIAPIFLPDSLDYDALVEQAWQEEEASDTTLAEDLGYACFEAPNPPSTPSSTPNATPNTPSSVASAKTNSLWSKLSAGLKGKGKRSATTPSPAQSATGSTSALSTASTPSYNHKRRASRRKTQRENQRAAAYDEEPPSERTLDEAIRKAKIVRLDMDASQLDAAKGAHTGKRGTKATYGTKDEVEKEYGLQELIDMGYIHIAWDGITPMVIVDRSGRIIAFLAGRPRDKSYVDDLMDLFDFMMAEGEKMGWDEDLPGSPHKRGWFHAFNRGVSMGMGSPRPVVLDNKKANDVLTRMVEHPAFKRLNGFQNSSFALWAPRLYRRYRDTIEKMYGRLKSYPRNFSNTVFAAAAFNFGGRVRTIKHRDHMNWPFGICVITAMGRFDPKRSALLVLQEFKLVIEFPHAATAAIPSACVTHFNTGIAPGDTRTSFTQYTAGAIFRWVENGFRTEKQLKEDDFEAWEALQERKKSIVGERLKLYSHIDEILTPDSTSST
ncbi:hypothetical protein VNI00_004722 [Paramarasmius palmivorus]|uniref:Uncharacterized protein n=1 Tax=Paramarasmius palmivorus TaxID=297713 RepID=A0AAW0DHW6_9AGAR